MDITFPRLTDRPFPTYRFVPGRNPHPTADPRGHSFLPPGVKPPAVELPAPEEWRRCEEYLYGCDLYNNGYWWEAHEAWEGLWHQAVAESAQKRFLQGIIQVSACHLKLHVGHLDGVARLRASSREHLEAAMERIGDSRRLMGVDVREFLERVDGYYAAVLSKATPPRHEAEIFPFLRPE